MKKRELCHLGSLCDDKSNLFIEQGRFIDAFDQAHLAYMLKERRSKSLNDSNV